MSMSRLTGAFGLVLVAGIALAVGSGHPAGRAEETPTPAAAAAADKDAPAAKEKKWLAGEWKLKHAETNGEALLTADDLDGAKIVFKDDTAEVKGFSVGFVRDFTFKLDPTKEPKEIDVTFTAGPRKGKTFEGIYLVRKNEMRICLRLEHPELGRPKGYVTNSGKTLYTFILEPAEKKDPPPKQDRPPAKPPVESPVATDLAAWEAIPVPDKTPFDGNAAERENYLRSYRDGFFWAKGNHLWCPTNPGAANLTAVRGWVEGWQAGVKAGGTSDLPAKYAPYLGWREPPGR